MKTLAERERIFEFLMKAEGTSSFDETWYAESPDVNDDDYNSERDSFLDVMFPSVEEREMLGLEPSVTAIGFYRDDQGFRYALLMDAWQAKMTKKEGFFYGVLYGTLLSDPDQK